MSTDRHWDDFMDVADAVGVTHPEPLHPSVRDHLADASLAGVLTSWSQAAAGLEPEWAIPLVPEGAVFADVGYCDTKHWHEIQIVTDGITAYAYSPGGTDCPSICRTGAIVVVACVQNMGPGDGDPCGGEVRFELHAAAWAVGDEAADTLARYGEPVDVGDTVRKCTDCGGQGCRERMVDGEVVDVACPWCKGTGQISGAA